MAAAKIMAKLQNEQNNIIQVANLHSKQGAVVSKYSRKRDINHTPPSNSMTTTTIHKPDINVGLLFLKRKQIPS